MRIYKSQPRKMLYWFKQPLTIVPEHQVGDWQPKVPAVCSYQFDKQCLTNIDLLGDGLLLVSDMILSMDTQDLHKDLATIIPSFEHPVLVFIWPGLLSVGKLCG